MISLLQTDSRVSGQQSPPFPPSLKMEELLRPGARRPMVRGRAIEATGLENSPGKPIPAFGRRRVASGTIVHQDEGIGGEDNCRLKSFEGMRERFLDSSS